MSKDPTFRVLGGLPSRSERYEAYRKEWDRREASQDASDHPVHVDLESVAVCDLRCGSSEEDPQGFCQIWTHEHIRTQGFDQHTYQRGYMDPVLYGRLIQQCADIGVSSIKLNYRGEPSLHPRIVSFIREAAGLGFPDIMMNTNGNGGARKNPQLFAQMVDAGITDLMFSVDACDPETYHRQRVGGNWEILLNSVRSAVIARSEGKGAPDCRIRASVVRTHLNAEHVDSGRAWRSSGRARWGSTGCRSRSATSPPAPRTTGRRPSGARWTRPSSSARTRSGAWSSPGTAGTRCPAARASRSRSTAAA